MDPHVRRLVGRSVVISLKAGRYTSMLRTQHLFKKAKLLLKGMFTKIWKSFKLSTQYRITRSAIWWLFKWGEEGSRKLFSMDLLIEMPSKIQIGDAAKVLAQLNKDPRDYENQWVSEFVSESLIGSSV